MYRRDHIENLCAFSIVMLLVYLGHLAYTPKPATAPQNVVIEVQLMSDGTVNVGEIQYAYNKEQKKWIRQD